jgi:prepilin-type N-terminal cleavage/methylation domain-containing protein
MKRSSRRAGFSIVELLIALVITSTLLTATLAALDASFKSYKVTSESASTHVVSRIVMQRLMAMVRNGEEFGPYPVNPLTTPTIESDWMEFVSYNNTVTGVRRVTTLARQENNGSFDLMYTLSTFEGQTLVSEETRTLIAGLTQLNFIMEYEVGPRLRRVTVDMVVQPNDLQDAAVAADLEAPTIRMVASASPRMID